MKVCVYIYICVEKYYVINYLDMTRCKNVPVSRYIWNNYYTNYLVTTRCKSVDIYIWNNCITNYLVTTRCESVCME